MALADDAVEAIVTAWNRTPDEQPLHIADVFIVNERGFVWDRPKHELYGEELVIPSLVMLGTLEAKSK